MSPIEQAEDIDTFLTDYLMMDDIHLSYALDPSTTNSMIQDYCMYDNVTFSHAKDHLRHGSFKSMINQKRHTRQHQWGNTSNNELLKPSLAKIESKCQRFLQNNKWQC